MINSIYYLIEQMRANRNPEIDKKKKAYASPIQNWLESYRPQLYNLPLGYRMVPSQQQLFSNNGKCNKLTIYCQFGSAQWNQHIDISTLKQPLADTIAIKYRYIEVYLHQNGKPKQGFELNKPCIATFNTREAVSVRDLTKICKTNCTRFLGIGDNSTSFQILIPHFSKFNFNELDDSSKKSKKEQSERSRSRNREDNRKKPVSTKQRRVLHGSDTQESKSYQKTLKKPNSKEPKLSQNELSNQASEILASKLKKYKRNEQEKKFVFSECKDVQKYNNMNQLNHSFEKIDHTIANLGGFMFKGDGGSFRIIQSQKSRQALEILPRPIVPENNLSFENVIFAMHKDYKMTLTQIICDQHWSFEVRRYLSLYAICFYQTLDFQMIKKQGKYEFIKKQIGMDLNESLRHEYLKNWLEWVVTINFVESSRIKTMFSSQEFVWEALSTRRPQKIFNQLILSNRYDDAQVLVNIEDQMYRKILFPSDMKICHEIIVILQEKISELPTFHWILRMAISVWYFDRQRFMDKIIQVIQSINCSDYIEFSLQFRIIQLFLMKQRSYLPKIYYIPSQPKQLQIIGIWIGSNMFSAMIKLEQDYYGQRYKVSRTQKNSKPNWKYKSYIFNIYTKLLQIFSRSPSRQYDSIQHLVCKSDLLSNHEKDSLLIFYVQKAKLEISCLNIVRKSVKDTLLEREALQMFKNGDGYRGAQQLIKIETISKQSYQLLIQFLTRPQILTNYKAKNLMRLKNILNRKTDEFQDLIAIVDVMLANKIQNLEQLNKIVRIISKQSRFSDCIENKITTVLMAYVEKMIQMQCLERQSLFSAVRKDKYMLGVLRRILRNSPTFIKIQLIDY